MILSASLKPVEKIINHYLSCDLEKAQALNALSGKILGLELIPLHFQCYLTIFPNRITLSTFSADPADVIVRGTPLALMGLLRQKGLTLPENVSITGDIPLVQMVRNIVSEIDIDWEEQLSHRIGDVMAHTLCDYWRKLSRYQQQANASLYRSLTEYLQEENRLFPPRTECNDFFQEVDTVRNDVERLAARIAFLSPSD